jgi:RNA 2',3'-cyclic 3'-phosphodiesterase
MMPTAQDGPTLRLFFALLPDASAAQRCAEVAALLDAVPGARRMPRGNYHVTLKFLGSLPARHLAALQAAAGSVRVSAFALSLDLLDYWPRAHAVVLRAQTPPPALLTLTEALQAACMPGVPAELPYLPHVTLARNVMQPPVLPQVFAQSWRIGAFSLVKSERGPSASIYTVVATWPLLDKPETI